MLVLSPPITCYLDLLVINRFYIYKLTSMSSNNSNNSNRRGRGGRRGARSSRGGRGAAPAVSSGPVRGPVAEVANSTRSLPAVNKPDEKVDTDEGICWICAEPVKFYAVAECNHRTCHICALRLRALYKRKDCTFCKVLSVILSTGGGWLTLVALAPSSFDYIHIIGNKTLFGVHA